MAPYLPAENRTVSPYSEGGALYALGIIHAGHGQGITDYLAKSLRESGHEVVQHGACLGLGLAAQGTDDDGLHDALKGARALRLHAEPCTLAEKLPCLFLAIRADLRISAHMRGANSAILSADTSANPALHADVLYMDSAVSGEAAGLAMGLLCCGAHADATDRRAGELLAYARETAHEKIVRGAAMGLAMACYGREEAADGMIEQLTRDSVRCLFASAVSSIACESRCVCAAIRDNCEVRAPPLAPLT
jgi:26S proteasome regulatory subunit N2